MREILRAMIACGVLGLGATAAAQGAGAPPTKPAPVGTATPAEHKSLVPDELKWGDAPPVFNKGARMAVLYGDPGKEGLFVVRLKIPAGYKIMPHWHPTDENVTVISGSFGVGMGDTLDAAAKQLPPGAFFSLPANMHHFAMARKDTIVEVSAMGPFQMTYVNAADDPSKSSSK